MKILQINSVCGFGSTGRIATDLYDMYEKQGHICKIAYGRGSAPEKYNTIKIGNKLDNYAHVLKTRLSDRHGFGSKVATKKFIREIEMFKPDIIHLHNIHGYYINIEILFNYLKTLDIKVIWTLHDCWAFTGHCAYYDYAECNKWKTMCEKCPQLNKYPQSKIHDNSKKNYFNKKELFTGIKNMILITPSKWLEAEVKKSFLKEYPVKTIYNGIDLNIFKKRINKKLLLKYKLADKKIILGVANIWDERKGLNTFIELNENLSEEYKIIIVGLTQKQIKKLPNNIIGIERTDSIEELVEIYSISDIYINTSYEETMGLTTVEALATGTNVIVRNKTALPEIVKYDKIKIFNEDNELLKKIEKVIQIKNEEENINLSKNFEKNKRIHEYYEVIEMLNKIKR